MMSEAHCNTLPQRKNLGLVTHDNTGGPFVVECQGCGEVYPSFHCLGGGQIADTGDYEDARCPHCEQVDPEECDNASLAWNTQQLKINELQKRLNAADQRIDELTQALERGKMWVGQFRAWYGDSGVVAEDHLMIIRTLRGLPHPPTEFDKPTEPGAAA